MFSIKIITYRYQEFFIKTKKKHILSFPKTTIIGERVQQHRTNVFKMLIRYINKV